MRLSLTTLLALSGLALTAAYPPEALAPPRAQPFTPNRAPLAPAAYYKLPVGQVRAQGWLKTQLDLQRAGLTGDLDRIFQDLGPESGWLGGKGESWERGPYYIRGATALAYVTGDSALIRKVRPWLEWSLKSQTADGFFGPATNKDWWPRWLMLQALQTHYEATADPRVIPFMQKFFAYEARTLSSQPIQGWAKPRGGENLLSIHWLYNRTGDPALLKLGDLVNQQTTDWTSFFEQDAPVGRRPDVDSLKWWEDSPQHTVNLAHGFMQPALVYEHTGAARSRAAVLSGQRYVMKYHGQVQGVHAGDERVRRSGSTRGSELCEIVEDMRSFEHIVQIMGDAGIADQLEKVAYNALPAAIMPNWKGRCYYITPNAVSITRGKRGFSEDHGDDMTYGVLNGYPCCTVNMHMGWPMLTEHLWLATPDQGLAATVYAPSEVTTTVKGTAVRITEGTDYPFNDRVTLTVNPQKALKFPLSVRVPGWCRQGARITINGQPGPAAVAASFVKINRTWKPGDKVELTFPMEPRTSRWENNSVGIERGPLVYALPVKEEWRPSADWNRKITDDYPAYEILGQSPWNYGLVLDENDLSKSLVFSTKSMSPQPWEAGAAPVQLTARARRIPSWTTTPVGHTAPVPRSPASSTEPEETVTLVPFGATRLRVANLPVIKP